MGAGIAKTIRDKYPDAYEVYREYYQENDILGKISIAYETDEQFPDSSHPRIIINMYRGLPHP